MPLAPTIANNLTTPANTGLSLYIDNVDVRSALIPGTLRIVMGGPGTTSTLVCTLDDPAVAIAIAAGAQLRAEHYAAGTLFNGQVDTYTYTTEFGGQGRQVALTGLGTEALLDQLVVAVDLVIAPGTSVPAIVNRILTNLTGASGPLHWGNSSAFGGDATYPVGLSSVTTDPAGAAFTISAGSTVRSGLQAMVDAVAYSTGTGISGAEFTVDPWYGVRVFARITDSDTFAPTDRVVWSPNPAGPIYPSNMRHVTDSTGLVRSVYVTGTGASAFVQDSSGRPGTTAFITVPGATTAAVCALFGADYLRTHGGGKRGDVTLEGRTDVGYGGAIGRVDLGPNASLGITAASVDRFFLTYSIDLSRFDDTARFDATIHYGGKAPSGAALIRTLTRAVAS